MRLVCSSPLTALLLSSSSLFLPTRVVVAARSSSRLAFTTTSRAFSSGTTSSSSSAAATTTRRRGVGINNTLRNNSKNLAFQSKHTRSSLPQQQQQQQQQHLQMSSSSTTTTEQVPNRVACLQFPVTSSKSTNHETATRLITNAVHQKGASLVILPEIWNSPYATAAFPEYAEVLPEVGAQLFSQGGGSAAADEEIGPSSKLLMNLAKQHSIHLIGGSIPEKTTDGKIYNTCLCVNPNGMIVGKHRKVHLFDIDVPGGITFKESDTLSAGDTFTAFDAGEPLGMIGVGICYDIRFPEYALVLCKKHKCNLLIYPGAFNMTTGPAHWELLQRARAVDNQCYVLTASPSRTEAPPKDEEEEESKYPHYTAWGHSTIVAPWGDVVATCDEGESIVVADLDVEKVKEMRMGIPTGEQKRTDMYTLSETE